MLEQVINLQTPAGRMVYRFLSVIGGQAIAVAIVAGADAVKSLPTDSTETTTIALVLGAVLTALDKFRRDTKASKPQLDTVLNIP